MNKDSRDFEVLSAFVHGAVCLGNLLGAISNAQKRNWKWAAIHTIGFGVHLRATLNHIGSTE